MARTRCAGGDLGAPGLMTNGHERLRVMVVDDDPIARRGVLRLLGDRPDVTVVGEFAGAEQALADVKRLAPDAVLLDIEMPGRSGFDVADALRAADGPYVIFVTAHDRYAVDAFRLHALDYVLKPVDRTRLLDALSRARREQGSRRLLQRVDTLLSVGASPPANAHATVAYVAELMVRVGNRDIVIPVCEVDWIEADSYYARLHVGAREYLLRESLDKLERRLDPRQFARVHRSAIVRMDRVREVRRMAAGERSVVLGTGARVRVSRKRWKPFVRSLRERTQLGGPPPSVVS